MSKRPKVAAAAAGLVALLVLPVLPPCGADVVVLLGDKGLPRGAKVKTGEMPGTEVLEEHEGAKTQALGYDVVKVSGQEASAGLVDAIYVSECLVNAEFQAGEVSGSSGYWPEAADQFGRAAEELKGVARQVALYKRAVALAQLNEIDTLLPAIDALVAEFPKTYYLGDLLTRKARGLLGKGDAAGAQAALDAVIAAPGMNKRDLHAAELTKVQLFLAGSAGKNKAKLAEAEAAFRARLDAIDKDGAAREELASLRLKALVGIGRMLVFQGKLAEAKPFLEQVIEAPIVGGDASMLAGAYTALGHVMFAEASAKQAAAGANQELRKGAAALLEAAVLHYLRVTELYGERADASDLYDASVSAARAFAALFGLTNDTDCDAARNSWRYYVRAHTMLGGGVERSQVGREGQELKARLEKACAPKPAADAPTGKPAEQPK